MGLFNLFGNGWETLAYGDTKGEPIPKWVEKAYWKWWNKLKTRPYGKVKYFHGKNFVYKIVCKSDVQGGSYYWYRKLKKKINQL